MLILFTMDFLSHIKYFLRVFDFVFYFQTAPIEHCADGSAGGRAVWAILTGGQESDPIIVGGETGVEAADVTNDENSVGLSEGRDGGGGGACVTNDRFDLSAFNEADDRFDLI